MESRLESLMNELRSLKCPGSSPSPTPIDSSLPSYTFYSCHESSLGTFRTGYRSPIVSLITHCGPPEEDGRIVGYRSRLRTVDRSRGVIVHELSLSDHYPLNLFLGHSVLSFVFVHPSSGRGTWTCVRVVVGSLRNRKSWVSSLLVYGNPR